MNLVDRFLNYVKFDTQSDELTNMTPSTPGQMVFAQYLRDELTKMGLSDITLDDNGYLMATLPANTGGDIPTVGFIAHLDTSPDMSGRHVNPRIVSKYDGGDIVLNAAEGIVLSPAGFPELKDYVGQDLIVTDGNTLLGADDKAGIAEIVGAVEYLKNHPEIEHGKIRIAFNPDEEIGLGAHKFNVEEFGADWAYTMDGGEIGELEYENFNAASARIAIRGRNIHPGMAKGKMINAIQVACELNAMLPAWERPEHTEGYEGFFHPVAIRGDVDSALMEYIIRDHSRERFEARKATLAAAAEAVNRRYGVDTVGLTLTDQYYNMREPVEACPEAVALARRAMEEVGVTPCVRPIRGGTDGARLSYMGLPCPNLFTGGGNFHGRYEYCSVDTMVAATRVIVRLAELWGAARSAAASSINKN